MQSLRHRRDPHYQGNRIRKAKRVIDKSGERNIEFVNIPERGWRFFKDFVTTLVILIQFKDYEPSTRKHFLIFRSMSNGDML